MKRQGFTLVELLVVVAIVVIMATMVSGLLARGCKGKGKSNQNEHWDQEQGVESNADTGK